MKRTFFFFSSSFMAVLLILLAISLALATFIEKDFGTMAAKGMIYHSPWIEMVFLLLAVNLSGQIFIHKLYRKEKLTVVIFHLAFVIMIAGAAVTHYTAFEGTMNIREGESSSMVISSENVTLPFSLQLNDFIVERYPGSESPSGFRSIVTVTDRDKKFSYEIYMNHILKYRGYRFFQASFDKDEKGTILSVSHDPAGTVVTYTGYGLLFLFIVLSAFSRHSSLRTTSAGQWKSSLRKISAVVVFIVISGSVLNAQTDRFIPDRRAAEQFGRVLVQDQKGRTEPLSTLAGEILRKVSKEKSFNNLTAMQVFMGYSLDFDHWQNVPLIKVSDKELQRVLNLKTGYAAFSDMVTSGDEFSYKLSSLIENAYSKSPSERTHFDKEVIKVDERVNICFMAGHGEFLRIFPVKDSAGYWGTETEAIVKINDKNDSVFIGTCLQEWRSAASDMSPSCNLKKAGIITKSLSAYQKRESTYRLPSDFKIRSEVFYNRTAVFEKLFPCYATAGLLLLVVIAAGLITGKCGRSFSSSALVAIIITGFIFHTLAIALRWFISGHSPMSNGYESMLFVSWVTMLAGFIFGRKTLLPMGAAALLAGMTLMVAHLSFMDPEITALVPVLRSYWLTLHVSVITGSYAFLGCGAVLGLIIMIMMIFLNNGNRERISVAVDQLTVINYKSLTMGLYLLTIGTFLGAVWANKSWGAYWSWDPKETWSLITIIVYVLVTHSRFIPRMNDVFIFNLFSVLAFASVLMTYFGVNFYLSGMHSYAAGEAQSMTGIVLVSIAVITAVTFFSGIKYFRQRNKAIG